MPLYESKVVWNGKSITAIGYIQHQIDHLKSLLFWQARREKISERMKVLQDLVPGCNKVHFDLNRHPVLFMFSHFNPSWAFFRLITKWFFSCLVRLLAKHQYLMR